MDYTLGSIGDLISGSPAKKKTKNAAPEENGPPKKQQGPNAKKKNSIGKSDLLSIMQGRAAKKNKRNSLSEADVEIPSPQGKKNKNKKKRKNSASEENAESGPKGKKRNKKNSMSENPQSNKKNSTSETPQRNKKNSTSEGEEPTANKRKPVKQQEADEEESDDPDASDDSDAPQEASVDSDAPQEASDDSDAPQEASDDSDAPQEAPNKKGKLTNAELRIKGRESKEKQKKVDELRADTKDQTIFVGNVSVKVTKKQLLKHFAKYGTVQSLRFRSVPLADTRTPKKVAAIKKEFHADRTTLNAYIQFATRESAVSAGAENGKLFEGTHIRVDLCTKELKHDDTKAIFIGNLSFTAEDEALWELFKSCGEIESVRIVRDNRTNVGKGFGYVNFASSDSVALALQMDGPKLNNRELRISACDNNKSKKRLKKFERKNQKPDVDNKENGGGMVEKKKTFPPRNKQFQGSKFTEKKKKNKVNKGDMKKKNMAKKFAPKEKV